MKANTFLPYESSNFNSWQIDFDSDVTTVPSVNWRTALVYSIILWCTSFSDSDVLNITMTTWSTTHSNKSSMSHWMNVLGNRQLYRSKWRRWYQFGPSSLIALQAYMMPPFVSSPASARSSQLSRWSLGHHSCQRISIPYGKNQSSLCSNEH